MLDIDIIHESTGGDIVLEDRVIAPNLRIDSSRQGVVIGTEVRGTTVNVRALSGGRCSCTHKDCPEGPKIVYESGDMGCHTYDTITGTPTSNCELYNRISHMFF